MRTFALGLLLCASCSSKGSPANRDGSASSTDGASTTSSDGAHSSDGDTAPGDASVTGTPEMIHYVGRFDTSGAAPQFDWSASGILAHFTGTGISVTLSDGGDNWFVPVIDGTVGTPFATSKAGTYTLSSTLPAGDHDVALYKRTESFFSTVTFGGFTVTGGSIVATVYSVPRRIEVIGDSISCGYGDTGMGPGCGFTAATEDGYSAYGPVTGRALAAETTVTAWSGKGVYRNNDGSTTELVPELWTRTIATNASSVYPFTAPAPDAVVINLGTNDFAKGDPGSAFTTAYTTFLTTLRGTYPNAWIFVTEGPLLNDPDESTCRGYLQTAIAKRSMAGDTKVTYVDFGVQDTSANGVGCDYHPSVKEHQVMATTLEAAIKAKLGW